MKNTHKVTVTKVAHVKDLSSRYFTKIRERVKVFGRTRAFERVRVRIYGRVFPYSYRALLSTIS